MVWFKRFAILGGIVILLEIVAWVGIATLGPDAFRQMIAFYDPRPEQAKIIEERDANGALRRCALFRGEVMCIDDSGDDEGGSKAPGADAATDLAALSPAPETTRCAVFEGQEICIGENR
ncbi:MAG: hypothetical protein V2I82_09905 [Halieaceae bacterium]|jgi:hypothetical protein|nr:hypothetical protein [Halieaceae bacterium]